MAEPNRRCPKRVRDQGPYHPVIGNGHAPWPMEYVRFRTDAGPCSNSMHQWGHIALQLCDCGEPPNNEAYCEFVPVDLLRRRHLRTTSSKGCSLQLVAETKHEIMKSKRQQQLYTVAVIIWN